MIDETRKPEEYENLVYTLANVFIGSIDSARKQQLLDRIPHPKDKLLEEKICDLELRASLFECLQ